MLVTSLETLKKSPCRGRRTTHVTTIKRLAFGGVALNTVLRLLLGLVAVAEKCVADCGRHSVDSLHAIPGMTGSGKGLYSLLTI